MGRACLNSDLDWYKMPCTWNATYVNASDLVPICKKFMADITSALIRCVFCWRKTQEDANVDRRTASPAYLSLLALLELVLHIFLLGNLVLDWCVWGRIQSVGFYSWFGSLLGHHLLPRFLQASQEIQSLTLVLTVDGFLFLKTPLDFVSTLKRMGICVHI